MKMGTNRLWMCAALIVILCTGMLIPADAALFGLFGSKKKAAATVRHSLVVFPFDMSESDKNPETMGADIASALRGMITSKSPYSAFLYTERMSPIKRAKEDNSLKAQEIAAPFSADKAKSLKLAQLLGTDYFLVGSIDDCSVDFGNKVAQLTLSAQLYDGKTGKLVKSFMVAGRNPQGATASDEDELRALAAGDAVAKLRLELESKSEGGAPPAPEK